MAKVYEELGETDCLASVNGRINSNPILNDAVNRLIGIPRRLDDILQSDDEAESRNFALLNFEIHYDPVSVPRSPQIQEWAEEGFEALQQRRGREAEVLFKKCLAAADAPDLMNNLAAAYSLQGRHTESRELALAIHAKWPEYFFGRIFMANTATLDGHFDVAEHYLRPMLTQQRFHITEFRALATAYIQLEIEQRRLSAAQSWLDLWKSVEPDHHDVKKLQQLIEARSVTSRLLQLLTPRWR